MASTHQAQRRHQPRGNRPGLPDSIQVSIAQHAKSKAAARLLYSAEADSQTHSRLFGRVPLDIRTMIWREILAEEGNDMVQITTDLGRLVRCEKFDYLDGKVPNQLVPHLCPYCYYHKKWSKYYYGTRSDILSLLLTCRRSYSEVAHILFSTRNFCFIGPAAASKFFKTTPPDYLHQIRSVQISWFACDGAFKRPVKRAPGQFDYSMLKAWHQMWAVLSKLQNLQNIKVTMFETWKSYDEEMMLVPLRTCRTKEFVVELPQYSTSTRDGDNGEYRDCLFKVIRLPFVTEIGGLDVYRRHLAQSPQGPWNFQHASVWQAELEWEDCHFQ